MTPKLIWAGGDGIQRRICLTELFRLKFDRLDVVGSKLDWSQFIRHFEYRLNEVLSEHCETVEVAGQIIPNRDSEIQVHLIIWGTATTSSGRVYYKLNQDMTEIKDKVDTVYEHTLLGEIINQMENKDGSTKTKE